nr:BadF/BadG/BcrA/BcrD ATPase family protein [Tissierella sp.]
MSRYLIVVDGGGTKTEFCISDIKGNPIKSYFRGTTNYKSVGLEAMSLNLKLGLNDILSDQRIKSEDIAYIVFGISGLDSDKDYNKVLKEIQALNISSENFYLCNDGLLSFYSAADKPGIIVVSGTGSIVLGINRLGLINRSGGWGYPFSSLGSGFYIGNELLKKTLLYCDGNYPYSKLFQKVKDYYRIKEFKDLPYRITDITNYYEIADASKIVTDNSNKDEPLAMEILNQAAAYLSLDVKNVYQKFSFENEDKINIVFSGGTLEGKLYSDMLEAKIKEELRADNIKFIKQESSPAKGGIKFAKKLYEQNK